MEGLLSSSRFRLLCRGKLKREQRSFLFFSNSNCHSFIHHSRPQMDRDDENSEISDIVALLEELSDESPEANKKKASRGRRQKAPASESELSSSDEDLGHRYQLRSAKKAPRPQSERKVKSASKKREAARAASPAAGSQTPGTVTSKRQKSKSAQKTDIRPPRLTGKVRQLGVDVGHDVDIEVLLEEFEDYIPNVDGAVVTTIKYRGE